MASSSIQRLPPYVYLPDLVCGRRVLEIGCGDGLGAHFLLRYGAASVLGVDQSPQAIGIARSQYRLANLDFRVVDYAKLELEEAAFDLVCVPAGDGLVRWLGFLEEARRVLASDGHFLVCTRSAESQSAHGGVSYYELAARLEPLFGAVRMIGVSPFVGVSLVEYADEDSELSELELDTTLLSMGQRQEPEAVADYVAVAGPAFGPPRGFTVVQFPTSEGTDAILAMDGRAPNASPETRIREAERLAESALTRLRDLEKVITQVQPRIAVTDAHLAPALEEAQRETAEARRTAEQATTQREALEERITELEQRSASASRIDELEAQLAAERASVEKTTARWKSAEAKSDELWRKIGELQKDLEAGREQAVENARQQRQAAQAALTRAVEEASKKLVSVRDEVTRTERERQALEQELAKSRAENGRVQSELRTFREQCGLPEIGKLVDLLETHLRNEELRLGVIEEQLRVVQGHVGMLPESQDEGATRRSNGSHDEGAEQHARQAREAMIRALAQGVDERDAKLSAMHDAVVAARRQVADMADLIHRTREQVLGGAALEVTAMLDRLAHEATELANVERA